MTPIIILGSSNPHGFTYELAKKLNYKIFNISTSNITFFDYKQNNHNDDFTNIIQEISTKHDRIILATPIYWYSMSAQMKMFLDRLSDLLINKSKNPLIGKSLYILSTYGGSEITHFETPFRLTANYMFMSYRGCLYVKSKTDEHIISTQINTFKKHIEKNRIHTNHYINQI